jgi:hypothetical protein
MQKLILETKTGFSSILPFKIYDNKGILFYSSDFVSKISKGERHSFNLPLGLYTVDGFLIKLPQPVKYKEIILPKPERQKEIKKYKIVFGENPNKCTIFYDRGIILFDKVFLSRPLYERYNIYFHELGHNFYKTEKFADLFAAKKMLEKGFNPSQIGYGIIDSLSSNQLERKKFTVKKIIK